MHSCFVVKRQSKRELCFADSRRGQDASQLRTSPLAGWSILWTLAWTIFPPPVLYGGPTTSPSRSRLRSDRRLEAASAGPKFCVAGPSSAFFQGACLPIPPLQTLAPAREEDPPT